MATDIRSCRAENAARSGHGPRTSRRANPSRTPTAAPLIPSTQTFRTEQVYVGDRDGYNLRPITAREGLIYFKLAWSPDGQQVAAGAEAVQPANPSFSSTIGDTIQGHEFGDDYRPGDAVAPPGAGALLMASMNVDAAAEPEFNEWYNSEHLPQLG